jgi:hypothetical protein
LVLQKRPPYVQKLKNGGRDRKKVQNLTLLASREAHERSIRGPEPWVLWQNFGLAGSFMSSAVSSMRAAVEMKTRNPSHSGRHSSSPGVGSGGEGDPPARGQKKFSQNIFRGKNNTEKIEVEKKNFVGGTERWGECNSWNTSKKKWIWQ